MARAEADASYILPNEWQHAERRLRCLEATYDPASFRHLDALGVGPGWRCLEVGAGGGSVTARLCQLVGATGRVTAVDLDPRMVSTLAETEPNLDVVRLDLTLEALPGHTYDLVHTRYLLMHLPGRDELLLKLLDAVRPGGWLLIEEGDGFNVALADGAYPLVWEAMSAAGAEAGMAWNWGRTVAPRLVAAGCTDVGVSAEAPYFRGGTTQAELFQLTWTQLFDRMIAAGNVSEPILEQAISDLGDPDRWFPGYGLLSTWGRRPVG
jgi:SAM-dependent methyltransferase